MQNYLNQLLEDLKQVAENPPPPPYIEVPPHMAEMPDMAELALSPPTTLEELTGIPFEAMPNILSLEKEQWEVLADALKRLLEALNIQIADLPDNYPDDALYDLIVNSWDESIQYLPLAGFDWEFCTGDPDTCPYGEDCNCGEPDEAEFPIYNGIYNDDGTLVEIENIHIPDLCLRCKSYLSDDWEENLLCNMNRNDQRDDDNFECGAFEEDEPQIPEN
jgi:hypothetical protein